MERRSRTSGGEKGRGIRKWPEPACDASQPRTGRPITAGLCDENAWQAAGTTRGALQWLSVALRRPVDTKTVTLVYSVFFGFWMLP